MSAGELAWRAAGRLRDAELWARLTLRLEPRPRACDPTAAGACTDPGFRVCDVSVGEWAQPKRDEERAWRDRLVSVADRVARHRLSFFGLVEADLGDPIDWNRDHESGRKAPLRFAPLVDYRDCRVVGDAKVVWEPNRHQHLVVLGRAYRATGEVRYASAVVEQLESWLEQCPFGRGMNWRSPLELAIRLINWVWTIDLIRESGLVVGKFRDRLREAIYLHLWEITRKYSRGSSANNHRIGEAGGVFIATSYFRDLDDAGRWRRESAQILGEEIIAQTYSDGGSREQAVGYHAFVLQFFLLAAIVGCKTGEDFHASYWSRVERMVEFLGTLSEGGTAPPMIGDSDDGYVLDLGDPHDLRALFSVGAVLFARPDFKAWAGAYAEAARWLLGGSGLAEFEAVASTPAAVLLVSHAFPESGYYLLECGHKGGDDCVSVVFDCGDLGFKSIAAHGHADALSFTLRAFGSDVFVDPGTYDYFSYPAWRGYFRSTRAHNALVVDGLDQSVMLGSFMWGPRARARCIAWEPRNQGGKVIGEHDGYTRLADPVLHRRTLELDEHSRILTIQDDIVAGGPHEIAAYFHLAEDVLVVAERPNRYRIAVRGGIVTFELDPRLAVELLSGSEEPIAGWVSREYHRKVRSTTLIARGRCEGKSSYFSRIGIGRVR
jgi:heparinase II/III-like protein